MSGRYAVVLSKLAQAKLAEFTHADHRLGQQLAKAIDRLATHPELGEFLKGDWKGYRKYRTGNYRIIYRIEHAQLVIYIVTVDDRKDVYR